MLKALVITLVFYPHIFETLKPNDLNDLCSGLRESSIANVLSVVKDVDKVTVRLQCVTK